MSRATVKPRAAVLFVFFVSGIGALLYQIVWLKYLGLVFGNTVHAAATLIAIFLAGLGIGAWLFSRAFPTAPPLVVYALLEALIGTMGALSPKAFDLLDATYVASYQLFVGSPTMLALARIIAAAIFLLPPTILMGGTLPVLVRWWAGSHEKSGRAVSSLYASNTFGAMTGVALAGFLFIPGLGFTATISIAVLLNFVLASVSAVLAWTQRSTASPTWEAPAGGGISRLATRVSPKVVLGASLLMGLAAIADEVFWSRILVLHLGSSVYAYSLMLFSFLVGITVGSAVMYRLIGRLDAVRWLGWLELALGTALVLQVRYFTVFSDVLFAVASKIEPSGYSGTLAVLAVSVLSALLVPTAIMGAAFPLAVKLHAECADQVESHSVGSIYLSNTIGTIAGSFLAGFALIPLVGSQNGLLLMAFLNLAIGATFAWRASARGSRSEVAAAILLALGVFVGMFALTPPDEVILAAGFFQTPGSKTRYFREAVTATVTLRDVKNLGLSLELNGVNVAGTSSDLIGTQKLQGHLPLLLHPSPKKILHIGFGSGGTAYSVSRHNVDEIVIAELSPEVLEVSDRYLSAVNHGVLHDPRARVVINDGRNFVMASPEKFDVILSDSIHPRYAGNGSLYTEDYFALCRKRLAPGGVISMWLPMYSLTSRNYLMIVRAFRDIFPNTTIWYVPNAPNAFTIVIGRLEDGPLPLDRIAQRLTEPVKRDLADIGMSNPYSIANAIMLDPLGVENLTRDVPPHTDDLPAVEYESGRLIDRELSWYENFRLIVSGVTPVGRAFSHIDDEDAMHKAEARRLERVAAHMHAIEGILRSRTP